MPGSLKLLWFTCWYVCVSAPEVINNQWRVIWCDKDCVQFAKQVLRLFPVFNYFHMALSFDKMDGHGHFNTACRERLPKKTKVTRY